MNREKEYHHDFNGECAPGNLNYFSNETFSVGIFQWIPKTSGKGLKKSSVKFRIKGFCSNPEKVYDAANRFCDLMDNGWIPDKKSMTI